MKDSSVLEYIMNLALNLSKLEQRVSTVERDIGTLRGNDTTLINLVNSLQQVAISPQNAMPLGVTNGPAPTFPDHETDIPEKHEGA